MKPIHIITIGALMMCACNESVSYKPDCDDNALRRCVDDYHYMECGADGPISISCCTPTDIKNGTCASACVMRDDKAVCETIKSNTKNAVCGNQIIESGEQCDGLNLNGHACSDKYGILAEGQISCNPLTCTVNYDNCKPASAECGNGILDTGEDCDSNQTAKSACSTVIADATGDLKCTDTCKYDYSDCVIPTCGNGIIDEGEDCDGDIPDDIKCNDVAYGMRGTLSCNDQCKLDLSECQWPKSGDYCQDGEWNLSTCDNDNNSIKCKNGVIQVSDCTKQNETCALFDTHDGMISDCIPDYRKCDNPNDRDRVCDYDGYSSITGVCTQSVNNAGLFWTEVKNGHVDQCPYSCSRETGDCVRLVHNQGEDCDIQSFQNHCEGNIAVNCYAQTYRYAIEAEECTRCDTIAVGNNAIALCVDNATECTPGDEDAYACYEKQQLLQKCYSNITNDKHYMLINDTDICDNGCDPNTGKCVKLSDEEGKFCKQDYKNKCINDSVLLYCSKNKIITSKVCNTDGNGECDINAFGAECSAPCQTVGETRSRCVENAQAYAISERCEEVNGKLQYQIVSKTNCESNVCNADYTDCLTSKVGQPCDPNELLECDENTMLYCDNGITQAMDCSLQGLLCINTKDFGAYCMNRCNNVGAERSVCFYYEGYGYVQYDYLCVQDDDGITYLDNINQVYCPNGCNDDETKCSDCKLGEVDSLCRQDSYGDFSTLYYICESDGKGGTKWNYQLADDGTALYTRCPDTCDDSEKQCKVIIDGQNEPCDKASFVEKCTDNYGIYCSSGGYTTAGHCNDKNPCMVSPSRGFVMCYRECNAESPVTTTCYPDSYYGGLVYEEACENVDGTLSEFARFLEMCPNGCNDERNGCKK